MIDTAMLRRIMTGCGMEGLVIDHVSLRLAQEIYKQAQDDELCACLNILDEVIAHPMMPIHSARELIKARRKGLSSNT